MAHRNLVQVSLNGVRSETRLTYAQIFAKMLVFTGVV